VLWAYGLAGVLVAAWFFFQVRNRPREYPRCNAAEIALIESGRPATASSSHGQAGALPLHYMVRSFSLWCSSVSQFGTNFGWVFLITWLPRYLSEYHRVPVGERGILASVPLLVGMVGMLGGGWLTDRLTRGIGLRWGRGLPMALTRFSAMAAYLVCLVLDSSYALTAAFCVVAFSTDLGTASVWAFKQDVGGKYVGSILGWGNMWGNLGAAVSPLFLNAAIEMGGWELCFIVCAAAFFLAGVAAFGVDATKPIVPPDVERTLDERGTSVP
jgi:nitrate/nitrite transporter NarK